MIYFRNLFTGIKNLLFKDKKTKFLVLWLIIFYPFTVLGTDYIFVDSENLIVISSILILCILAFFIAVFLRKNLSTQYRRISKNRIIIEFFQILLLSIPLLIVWLIVSAFITVLFNHYIFTVSHSISFFLPFLHVIGVILVDFFLEKEKKDWSLLKLLHESKSNKKELFIHIFFLSVFTALTFASISSLKSIPEIFQIVTLLLVYALGVLVPIFAQLIFVNRLRK